MPTSRRVRSMLVRSPMRREMDAAREPEYLSRAASCVLPPPAPPARVVRGEV